MNNLIKLTVALLLGGFFISVDEYHEDLFPLEEIDLSINEYKNSLKADYQNVFDFFL
jgi:hypothetical protein